MSTYFLETCRGFK